MRRAFGFTVVLMLLLSVQVAYAGGPPFPVPPTDDYDLFLDQVELRPGVTTDIHVKVFVNHQRPWHGKTVFAIHGGGHTAQSWDQYAEAVFTHPFKGPTTGRLVAIDLPGRGQSTGLNGMSFGELLLDDDVTAILETLERLQDHGIYPTEIIGHCSGGLTIQMAQERLVQSGSSLFQEYGISRAVLLSPSVPAPMAWHWADAAEAFIWFLVPADPPLGWHFDVPAEVYLATFYSNLFGEVSPDAPSAEEIDARGYRAPWPLFWVLQIFGETGPTGYPDQPFFPRPEISPGIFGLQSGTLLHVVSYVDDLLVFPSQATEQFDHLVCCPWWSRNTVVEAEDGVYDRVHALYISNPAVIIEAMSEDGWFVW
jgi:pimeloyl-ACP methyl ester carboxylesterase